MAKSRLKLKFSVSISVPHPPPPQYIASRSKRDDNENVAQTSILALENFANSKSVLKFCFL